ncbi:MAG: acyltransferase [Actinomycetota bacterium]|nr:acyltransferase [Actinomycetota bacterium]
MTDSSEASPTRDRYIDFLRAFSLLVVVAWHWVFTIVIWKDDGPHATSPIGFTTGLWAATWLLQVMPLFFYVGGYSHLISWQKAQAKGERLGSFVFKRLKRLAVPAIALFVVWVVAGIVLGAVFNLEWMGRAVLLVVSPLWFMGVYIGLVALLPVFLWLHERFDSIVLVFFAAAAGAVDILRFRYDHEWLGILNMITVWGLCHQLGFFYQRLVHATRRADWTLLWAGLAGLAGLVFSGLYPGSMVGVPGERSNMAPPTLCIVALVLFQAGVAEVLRPRMEARLVRVRWAKVNDTINRFSMPLFLFHTTGMAMHRAVTYALAGKKNEARSPDGWWWLSRPFAFIGPLLFTLPVIYLFGRQWVRPKRGAVPDPAAVPASADA